MKVFRTILINGFTVRTTGYTIFSIFKTFSEATAAMNEEIKEEVDATGKLVDKNEFYVDRIKDDRGIGRAYVVRRRSYQPFILRFTALSDAEIEIIEFETKGKYFEAKDAIVKDLISDYKKAEDNINNKIASESDMKEFTAAESWYKNLSFEDRKNKDVIDIASESFGTINGKKLTNIQLATFAYFKTVDTKNYKKQFIKSHDVIDGEYDEEGNYDPHALFNARVYVDAWKNAEQFEFLIEQGFKYKTFNMSSWYEKDNVTADEIRQIRSAKITVDATPMKYSRSDDYRTKYLRMYAEAERETVVQKDRHSKGKSILVYRCAYCGQYFTKKEIEVDHIIPIKAFRNGSMIDFAKSKGIEEANDPANLCFACKDCNSKKGSSTSSLWIHRGLIGKKDTIWKLMRRLHELYSILMLYLCYAQSRTYNAVMHREATFSQMVFTVVLSLLLLAGLNIFGKVNSFDEYRRQSPFTISPLRKIGNIIVYINAMYYGFCMFTSLYAVVPGVIYGSIVTMMFALYLKDFRHKKPLVD